MSYMRDEDRLDSSTSLEWIVAPRGYRIRERRRLLQDLTCARHPSLLGSHQAGSHTLNPSPVTRTMSAVKKGQPAKSNLTSPSVPHLKTKLFLKLAW